MLKTVLYLISRLWCLVVTHVIYTEHMEAMTMCNLVVRLHQCRFLSCEIALKLYNMVPMGETELWNRFVLVLIISM